MKTAVILETTVKISPDDMLRINSYKIPVISCPSLKAYRGWENYITEYSGSISDSLLMRLSARMNGLPAPIAQTERLIIRELSIQDYKDFCRLYECIPKNCISLCPDINCYRAYIDTQYSFYDYGLWCITLKEDGSFAGICGFSSENENGLEAAYGLLEKYRGMGIAKEAVSACIKYARKELDAEKFYAVIPRDNTASLSLAQKLNMKIILK